MAGFLSETTLARLRNCGNLCAGSGRKEKTQFTDRAHCRLSLRAGRRSAMGRSCYSGVTLFCIIKGDLRLLCPRQCCTITEVDFGYGDGVTLVDQPF